MQAISNHPAPKKSAVIVCYALSLAILLFCSCGESSETNNPGTTASSDATVTLPPYTIVKSDVDEKDATYRVQVGDTLPNEQESIAIFRKVSGITDHTTSRNTAVYLTRAGFSAISDAHAYVMFTKSDEAPSYKLQTADNASLKAAAALSFDSIADKQLVVEMIDAHATKHIVYKNPSGGYYRVIIFSQGSYDISPIKAGPGNSANKIVLINTDGEETFTYKEDETGKMMEVYNDNNSLMHAYKILKKG